MRNIKQVPRRTALWLLVLAVGGLLLSSAGAATWKGLEPFVSKRADVERVLGKPSSDRFSQDGTMEFKFAGSKVTVFFVTPKFLAAKKLPAAYEGTVLQIVLQHERAQDTPESMNLVNNKAFKREANRGVEKYSDQEEGLYYTFVEGRLKTTRYSYSAQQLAKIQREMTPQNR